ncbi:MAG: FAD/NAD(P)-binding protein [Pseudomonadota bacterium]
MATDSELGLGAPISRRDLLVGAAGGVTALAAGVGSAPASGSAANARPRSDYPPGKIGLRGAHVGSFEVAHELAMGGRRDWDPLDDDEAVDLVVVGAGVSGLAAAHYYREHEPGARVLLLDNHDDFGGHAKRNEFMVGGRRVIGYGGSQSMEAPGEYSDVAKALLADLAVDVDAFDTAFDRGFHARHGLSQGVYFDAATYGAERWVPTALTDSALLGLPDPKLDIAAAIAQMPLPEAARAQLRDLYLKREDGMPDVGLLDTADYLGSISYERFLERHAGVTEPELQRLLRRMTTGYYGVGTDATPALAAILFGLPGINKTGVLGARWLRRRLIDWVVEPYIHHFPDGNASIARLLVQRLIPEVARAQGPAELVGEFIDYGALDRAGADVRLRLSSTAVQARNLSAGEGVEVLYRHSSGGATRRVRARHCVLAGYNAMVPHLCPGSVCPELKREQREALAQAVKVPLVYTNVALNSWHAVKRQGMGFAYTPGGFHSYCMVDFPVSMGDYAFAESPDDPLVLHFSEALIQPGLAPRDQHRAGRARLLATAFETIERDVRSTLAGILGPAGFDPARDIAAITVNRWPHGYAYEYNPLFDPDYEPGQAPHEIARRRIGNIAIANSDAGARAYLDEAIDQAHRAVGELV